MTSLLRPPDHRPGLQGLRAFAVTVVVLFHAGMASVPGGYVGVDIFFVISGYLISGLLVREAVERGRIDWLRFFARRTRRLLPAAAAVVAAVALAAQAAFGPLEAHDVFSAARSATLYAANLWFEGRAADYFGGAVEDNPLLHMWSLAVEEQFYVLWPLLIALAVRVGSVDGRRRRLGTMFAIAAVATLVACIAMTQRSQPTAFFGMPFRIWEFALGALARHHAACGRRLTPQLARAAGVLGAATVVGAVLALHGGMAFPGAWAALPAVGTALVLLWLDADGRTLGLLRALLESRPAVAVGDMSYSWYLWHWPVLVFLRVWWPAPGAWATAAAVIASLALAAASYRWIETPLRAGVAEPRRAVTGSLVLAGAFTLATAFALTLLMQRAAADGRRLDQSMFSSAARDRADVYGLGCHAQTEADDARECVHPAAAPAHAPVVVLLGDSHAAQWYPALARIAERRGWRLVSMTKSSCPTVDTPVVVQSLRRRYDECERWRAKALERVAELRPALLVLAQSSRYDGVDAEWAAALGRTIERAVAGRADAAVALMRDTPWPEFDVPNCLARAVHQRRDPARVCTFDRDAGQAFSHPKARAEQALAADRPATVRWVDMHDVICPQPTCAVYDGRTVRYSDGHHLTATYARELADALDARLPAARRPADH